VAGGAKRGRVAKDEYDTDGDVVEEAVEYDNEDAMDDDEEEEEKPKVKPAKKKRGRALDSDSD
jgi:hypothetical protein